MTPVPARHLVLVGPTASGKSALALAWALAEGEAGRSVEIVSVDSMAVYRGMDIGTAKPAAAERALVPHHLLDVVDPDHEYSVAEFQAAAAEALSGIEARGANAVLVGGTGLYVDAVVDGFTMPGRWPDVRAELESSGSTGSLYGRLVEQDPVAAARIEPGNRRRIVRALEVCAGSGRPFSSFGPGLQQARTGSERFVMVGLRLPRAVLTERIAARYDVQMAAGFLAEVERLRNRWGAGLGRNAGQALGYRELLAHLAGDCSREEALAGAVRRTVQFAKRQERWFRRDPRITWIDAPGSVEALRAAVAS